jgi:dephospho-CoA kinase
VLKVGLTGGIACGKSAVMAMFAARGAHTVNADEIAHRLMLPGKPVYAAVVAHFGEGILNTDGAINRQKLAAIAFAPEHPRIEELNQLVHPAVVAHQDRWSEQMRAQDPDGIAMVEAALIFEAGVRDHFDRVIVVVCDPQQKVERLAQRLGVGLDIARREVERRSRAQWTDTEKARLADYVIYNTGSIEDTEKQVDRVFGDLKGGAAERRK